MSVTESHRLHSLADTQLLAESLARQLQPGDVLALHGDLGAGKTTFAQHLIQALGGSDVTSPTFNLLQTYLVTLADGRPSTVFHYDLYRITHADELTELGFDAIGNAIAVIEWPQRLADPNIITIAVSLTLHEDGSRTATIEHA